MKAFVVSLSLLISCSSAFADLHVIQTPLAGDALNGPNGLIQIIKPYFVVRYGFEVYDLKSDDHTGTAACALINKQYVSHASTPVIMKGVNVAAFDPSGVVELGKAIDETVRVMSILVCK